MLPGGQNQLGWYEYLATLAAQPNYSTKNPMSDSSSGNCNMVTAAPVRAARCIYTSRALSVCLSAHLIIQHRAMGFMQHLLSSQARKIPHICKSLQLVAELGVQINICPCVYLLMNKFSEMILYSCGHNLCTQRP